MLNKLKPKSDFTRNVLTLMTGTTIAQAIPIAISPILTRIYTPEDFGVFALYIAIVSLIAIFATGQYENAIMIPSNNEHAYHITLLAIYINITMSIILFLTILFFNQTIVNLLGHMELNSLLYFAPISVLAIGLINTFNYWFTRQKDFQQLSYNHIIQSSTNATFSISFGLLTFEKLGLIIGQILGQSFVAILFIKRFLTSKYQYKFNKYKILYLMKRYRNFPKITLAHGVFSSLSNHLPTIILTTAYSTATAGFYFLAFRVVALPLNIISTSFYRVFFQEFSKTSMKEHMYKNRFLQINLVLIPLFTALWFILPSIFSFIFGSLWEEAGIYTQILLPLLYMKFISNLFTSTVYIYYERQMENFLFSLLITLLIFVSLTIGAFLDNIILGLILMSVSNSLVILVKLYRAYTFTKEATSVKHI